MKKLIFLTIITFFAVNASAADFKIAYVDLNKALNECNKGKTAVKILEDMVKEKQTVISEKEKELKALDDEIAKQSSILNPDAIREKQAKRERLMRDYQRMVKDSQDEVQLKRNDFMEAIIKDLRETVARLGKDQGYSVIFERVASGILYIPEEVDITDALIEQFNKESQKK